MEVASYRGITITKEVVCVYLLNAFVPSSYPMGTRGSFLRG